MTASRREGSVFNIGNQQAATINNAGRDQVISFGVAAFSADVSSAVADIRSVVESARLTGTERQEAHEALDVVEAEVTGSEPDRERVAAGVQKALTVLQNAGALAQSAAALVPPTQVLARWLGPAGAALLASLA